MNKEIEARYIRFLPVTWFNHVCMKVELYGYQGMIDNWLFDWKTDWLSDWVIISVI